MSGLKWVSESDVRNAIADVRKDGTPTDWMLIKYENPKSQSLTLAGSGGYPFSFFFFYQLNFTKLNPTQQTQQFVIVVVGGVPHHHSGYFVSIRLTPLGSASQTIVPFFCYIK